MREVVRDDAVAVFIRAVDDLHRRFDRAGHGRGGCEERFAAVVASVVAWLADHPDQARLYWCDWGTTADPDLRGAVLRARRRLTDFALRHLGPDPLTTRHEVNIEYLVGLVRQVVDEELQKPAVDLGRLAERLARLGPLLSAHDD
ncbi:hypothetical protein [Saccharothrix hoggarensis]|uniref:Uncharacterized protein n=1 Tax=Saccharothrix hoggarensis TaxID=913853 RepID=A0ABW3QX95_9PSEU